MSLTLNKQLPDFTVEQRTTYCANLSDERLKLLYAWWPTTSASLRAYQDESYEIMKAELKKRGLI